MSLPWRSFLIPRSGTNVSSIVTMDCAYGNLIVTRVSEYGILRINNLKSTLNDMNIKKWRKNLNVIWTQINHDDARWPKWGKVRFVFLKQNPEPKKKSSVTYLAPRRGGYRLIGIRSFKTHKNKFKETSRWLRHWMTS